VSENIPVVTKPILSIPSPELVSILKRVPSNSEVNLSNTASPNEAVFASSGCAVKVDRKSVKDRKTHKDKNKDTDKDESTQYSASEGVTVDTVNKRFKFNLKKSKNKSVTDNSSGSDSESESVTIKRQSRTTRKKWLYPQKYDGSTPLHLFLSNVETMCNLQ